jgi:hypothetical protein
VRNGRYPVLFDKPCVCRRQLICFRPNASMWRSDSQFSTRAKTGASLVVPVWPKGGASREQERGQAFDQLFQLASQSLYEIERRSFTLGAAHVCFAVFEPVSHAELIWPGTTGRRLAIDGKINLVACERVLHGPLKSACKLLLRRNRLIIFRRTAVPAGTFRLPPSRTRCGQALYGPPEFSAFRWKVCRCRNRTAPAYDPRLHQSYQW